MDLDYMAAEQSIEDLKEILRSIKWGERTEIADDIIKFVNEMTIKYKQNDNRSTT